MSIENLDELEPRNGSIVPAALPLDATLEDIVMALNQLTVATRARATAARTHSVELEGIRLAIQEHGTRIETFCKRIETALGVARNRTTDPAPKPEGD